MEKTLFKRFCMAQNLHALFNEQQLPPTLYPLILEYERTFQSDIRGTLLSDNISFDVRFRQRGEEIDWTPRDLSKVPKEVQVLLQEWIQDHSLGSSLSVPLSVYMRQKITRLGQNFRTSKTSKGDSNVVFKQSRHENWSAGSIKLIFSFEQTARTNEKFIKTFFLVDEYPPLSPDQISVDHFRKFPAVGGRLFNKESSNRAVLVSIDEVACHAATSLYNVSDEEFIHVLPLDKVGHPNLIVILFANRFRQE
jgi:hypothetical protein